MQESKVRDFMSTESDRIMFAGAYKAAAGLEIRASVIAAKIPKVV